METRQQRVCYKNELLCEVPVPIIRSYKDIRGAESLFKDKADFLKAVQNGLQVVLCNRARYPFFLERMSKSLKR